jgi:hypothetical protein
MEEEVSVERSKRERYKHEAVKYEKTSWVSLRTFVIFLLSFRLYRNVSLKYDNYLMEWPMFVTSYAQSKISSHYFRWKQIWDYNYKMSYFVIRVY